MLRDQAGHLQEPRLFTWCIPEEDLRPEEGSWRLDNVVETLIDPTLPAGLVDGDLASVEWGSVRLPIRDQPVCPPFHIDPDTRQLHEEVVRHDGRQRFWNPQTAADFALATATLQIAWPDATLVRVPIESRNDRGYPRRVAEHFDMTLPGYWLMMPHEGFSPLSWAEDMRVPYFNPQTGLSEPVWTDVTERRDTCKD